MECVEFLAQVEDKKVRDRPTVGRRSALDYPPTLNTVGVETLGDQAQRLGAQHGVTGTRYAAVALTPRAKSASVGEEKGVRNSYSPISSGH